MNKIKIQIYSIYLDKHHAATIKQVLKLHVATIQG